MKSGTATSHELDIRIHCECDGSFPHSRDGNVEPTVLRPATLTHKDHQIFTAHLEAFADCEPLRVRVLTVLSRLPEVVQRDFLDDPRFRIALENFVPGEGWSLWMASPGPVGSGSRCVVLRPKLADCSEAFALYVIAHEFAHAHLHNGGWGEITDIEEAADALAASWGYQRPNEGLFRPPAV